MAGWIMLRSLPSYTYFLGYGGRGGSLGLNINLDESTQTYIFPCNRRSAYLDAFNSVHKFNRVVRV